MSILFQMLEPSGQVNFRCPPDVEAIIERETARTNETRTDVILRALRGLAPSQFDAKKTEDAIATLQKQIEFLRASSR